MVSESVDEEVENIKKLVQLNLQPKTQAENFLSPEADLAYLKHLFTEFKNSVKPGMNEQIRLDKLNALMRWFPAVHDVNGQHLWWAAQGASHWCKYTSFDLRNSDEWINCLPLFLNMHGNVMTEPTLESVMGAVAEGYLPEEELEEFKRHIRDIKTLDI